MREKKSAKTSESSEKTTEVLDKNWNEKNKYMEKIYILEEKGHQRENIIEKPIQKVASNSSQLGLFCNITPIWTNQVKNIQVWR